MIASGNVKSISVAYTLTCWKPGFLQKHECGKYPSNDCETTQ